MPVPIIPPPSPPVIRAGVRIDPDVNGGRKLVAER